MAVAGSNARYSRLYDPVPQEPKCSAIQRTTDWHKNSGMRCYASPAVRLFWSGHSQTVSPRRNLWYLKLIQTGAVDSQPLVTRHRIHKQIRLVTQRSGQRNIVGEVMALLTHLPARKPRTHV